MCLHSWNFLFGPNVPTMHVIYCGTGENEIGTSECKLLWMVLAVSNAFVWVIVF